MIDTALVSVRPNGPSMTTAWKLIIGSGNGGSISVTLKVDGQPGSAVGTIGGAPNRPTPSTIVPPSGNTPTIGGPPKHVGMNRPGNGFGIGSAPTDQTIVIGEPGPSGNGPSPPTGTETTSRIGVPGGA